VVDGQFFDGLAKGLDDGSVSRGRALKLVGGGSLGCGGACPVSTTGCGWCEKEMPQERGHLPSDWKLQLRIYLPS
jgi:hypothetical protein